MLTNRFRYWIHNRHLVSKTHVEIARLQGISESDLRYVKHYYAYDMGEIVLWNGRKIQYSGQMYYVIQKQLKDFPFKYGYPKIVISGSAPSNTIYFINEKYMTLDLEG